jgi:hypothetical protein
MVKEKGSASLPMFSQLSKAQQLEAEEQNVRKCLAAMPA